MTNPQAAPMSVEKQIRDSVAAGTKALVDAGHKVMTDFGFTAPMSAEDCARDIGNALYRYFTPETLEEWQQAAIADTPQNVMKREAITAVICAFSKIAQPYLQAYIDAHTAPLREAASNVRKFCIPGMNWTDEIGQQLLAELDADLAGKAQPATE